MDILSPKLLFVRHNILYAILLVLFVVCSALNLISDNVFIAYRSSKYIVIKNIVSSLVKLALPIFLMSLGAYGLFACAGISIVVAFTLSLVFLIAKFNYSIEPIIRKEVVKRMATFGLQNYVAGSIGALPVLILPIMILHRLDANFAAYFYMDMTIATLLYIIPMATSQSLFAEGSYNETEIAHYLAKAIRMNFSILIPAIVITLVFGKYILLGFGERYSSEGSMTLQLLAISGIFLSINNMGSSVFYVRHKVQLIILVNCIGALVIFGLSYLLTRNTLVGVGVAWIIGQGVMSLIYLVYGGWGKIAMCFVRLARNHGIPFIVTNPVWSIGIYAGTSPTSFVSIKNINPVLTAKDVTDAPAAFVADPFMVKEKSTWYMFFEVLNIHTNRGEIGVATSNDNYSWQYEQIVLKEPFHLSYPYVFKWQHEHYMIPECSGTNSVRLYKAIDFPTRWSFMGTLIEGRAYADPSVVHFHDKWWLFTASPESNILRLHHANDLMGPWTEHPQSPIINDNAHIARPGGRVVRFEDRLMIIRYAQDCAPTYGRQVGAFQITELTTTSYKEQEVRGNPVLKATGTSWNRQGMHHIDPHLIGRDEWIACVDGHVEKLRFGFNDQFLLNVYRLFLVKPLQVFRRFLQG
jgi:O-antigen/teichoic acid export membrane protein